MLALITGCGASSDSKDKTSSVDDSTQETNPLCVTDEQSAENNSVNWQALLQAECKNLSSYNLFRKKSDPRIRANANTRGMSYELNAELFTDYARKYRYFFIPAGGKMTYSEDEAFHFPVGSVLVKVFSLPVDTALAGETIIEIRLLIHRQNGWVGLVYVWQESLADAVLDLDSESIEFSLTHKGEVYSGEYRVPSFGSCANCHQYNKVMVPIGPKARLLNKDIKFEESSLNQLTL